MLKKNMSRSRYILVFAILMLALAGCRKTLNINHEQKIFFQMDHTDFSPEYQHYGLMVDSKGNILTYNNPPEWNFPLNDMVLTEEQVEQNISMCNVSGKIDIADVARFASYIGKISSSKVTALKDTGSDTGSTHYICYEYGEDLKYHGSIMKMEGDLSCENLNFYTKKVVLWMKDLEKNLKVE